jgi:hypothetical protein
MVFFCFDCSKLFLVLPNLHPLFYFWFFFLETLVLIVLCTSLYRSFFIIYLSCKKN